MEELVDIRGVFSDIDDTVSTSGKITSESYDALWRLSSAGLKLVMVTGRPAGWCDHIARFWPVDAVVGENGGFYFYHDGSKLVKKYQHTDEERLAYRERLVSVRDRILAEVPGSGIASDQLYREYDIAIDFCEDVEPLSADQVQRIKEIFEEEGANAKISSIHVNGWYGDFDKLSTTKLCAMDLFGVDLDAAKSDYVFCGDSPNDQPMFEFFPLSFGMANVKPFLSMMDHHPARIMEKESGAGFCDVADMVLSSVKRSSV